MKKVFFILFIFALVNTGCDNMTSKVEDDLGPNSMPEIISVISQEYWVEPDTSAGTIRTISLYAEAWDADSDILNFNWSAATGPVVIDSVFLDSLDNSIYCRASWEVPSVQGIYELSFNVTDNALSDTETVSITIDYLPSNLAAEVLDFNTVELKWDDKSVVENGFIIQRSMDVSGGFVDIAEVGNNITSFTDNGVEDSVEYFYRITAFNEICSSPYSNTTSIITIPLPFAGLIAYYPLDDGQAIDLSVGMNDGLIHGSVSSTDNRKGNSGSALTLGGNSYIELPPEVVKSGDFSLCVWIYRQTTWPAGQPILYGSGGTSSFYFTPNRSGTPPYFEFLITDGGSEQYLRSLPPVNTTYQWIFVSLILEGNTGKLYKDGVKVYEGSFNTNLGDIAWDEIGLGGVSSTMTNFNGALDDVRIYNRALTDGEIWTLFNE